MVRTDWYTRTRRLVRSGAKDTDKPLRQEEVPGNRGISLLSITISKIQIVAHLLSYVYATKQTCGLCCHQNKTVQVPL